MLCTGKSWCCARHHHWNRDCRHACSIRQQLLESRSVAPAWLAQIATCLMPLVQFQHTWTFAVTAAQAQSPICIHAWAEQEGCQPPGSDDIGPDSHSVLCPFQGLMLWARLAARQQTSRPQLCQSMASSASGSRMAETAVPARLTALHSTRKLGAEKCVAGSGKHLLT